MCITSNLLQCVKISPLFQGDIMKTYQVRVYFEDTDCGGIVYHTNYLKYCERARSELFFTNSMQPFVEKSGFVLKKIDADFIASGHLGDKLEVRNSLIECKNVSLRLKQDVYRIYDALKGVESDDLLFSADITLAFVDVEKGKPCKIPPFVREVIHTLE